MGLDEYMQLEGMVWRVVQKPNPDLMDLDRTQHNLWNVYQYRGIADPAVYKDKQIQTLLRNYTASFHQLALNRWKRNENDQAIAAVEKFTQRNNHTEARLHLATLMGNKRLAKFYNAMHELRDVFNGYGPELSKLNQKMEKELYKQLYRTYSNYDDIYNSL